MTNSTRRFFDQQPFVVLRADRLGLAVAVRLQAVGLDAVLDEVGLDRRRAVLGQLHVVVVVAALVGVALDLDRAGSRVALQRRRDRVEDRERDRLDDRLGRLEVDLVEDLELALAQDDAPLVRAAVLVLEAVVGLRLVRALVVLVEDAVLVVVRIGAAVLVLEAVLVLGIVRAQVVDVEDAVLVVVRIGAAVLVLEAVLVLGIVGALVDAIGDAVAVAIEIERVGAAVLVLEAVLGLRLVRALVVDVGDAVAIVVRIGAAVLVLEAVEVLRIVRALVDVVLDAVAVAVADRRLEDEADEDAEVRASRSCRLRPMTRQEAGAAADLEVGLGRQVDLDREQALERARRRRAGQPGVAERFTDEVELVGHEGVRHAEPVGELRAERARLLRAAAGIAAGARPSIVDG